MVPKFCLNIFELHRADKCILCLDDYNNHKDIPVLPFAKYSNLVERKPKKGYPLHPISIGDHIKKRRMDLRLLQKELADLCNVSEDTIVNWENNKGEPKIMHYPNIISFLGFFPFEIDSSTIGGKILRYRYQHGLSQRKFARIIGVDATTIANWESNRRAPSKYSKESLKSMGI